MRSCWTMGAQYCSTGRRRPSAVRSSASTDFLTSRTTQRRRNRDERVSRHPTRGRTGAGRSCDASRAIKARVRVPLLCASPGFATPTHSPDHTTAGAGSEAINGRLLEFLVFRSSCIVSTIATSTHPYHHLLERESQVLRPVRHGSGISSGSESRRNTYCIWGFEVLRDLSFDFDHASFLSLTHHE